MTKKTSKFHDYYYVMLHLRALIQPKNIVAHILNDYGKEESTFCCQLVYV